MKTSYLFPYRFKKASGFLFWISLLLICGYVMFDNYGNFEIKTKVFAIVGNTGLLGGNAWFSWVENSIVDEILFILLIISGLVYAFSKEKTEDEMVSKIRLDSLVWATYFNYIIILLCYMFLYGFAFLNVMMVALFSHLLFFIIRFRWMMYKQNKLSYDEE